MITFIQLQNANRISRVAESIQFFKVHSFEGLIILIYSYAESIIALPFTSVSFVRIL